MLRIEEVPGAAAARRELETLTAAGRALNHAPHIDRDAISRLKLAALELLWSRFSGSAAFDRYRRNAGAALPRFAIYCAREFSPVGAVAPRRPTREGGARAAADARPPDRGRPPGVRRLVLAGHACRGGHGGGPAGRVQHPRPGLGAAAICAAQAPGRRLPAVPRDDPRGAAPCRRPAHRPRHGPLSPLVGPARRRARRRRLRSQFRRRTARDRGHREPAVGGGHRRRGSRHRCRCRCRSRRSSDTPLRCGLRAAFGNEAAGRGAAEGTAGAVDVRPFRAGGLAGPGLSS